MKWYRLTTTVAVLCGVCGCIPVSTTKIKAHKVGQYAGVAKVPLTVELRMDDKYRTAERRPLADIKLVFGEYLTVNTEDCARAAFTNVLVTKTGTNAPAVQGAQAILVPRVLHLDVVMDYRLQGFKGNSMSLALEWELQDPSGKLLWVDTFKAQRDRGSGKVFFANFDDMTRQVVEESYGAFTTAPEIRAFVSAAGSPGQ